MDKKEADNPVVISNFELNRKNNSVIVYVNSKIFPISSINKASNSFKERAWVVVDKNDEDFLVELKPKNSMDLELLAREFNNELLDQSIKDVKIDSKSEPLLSRIKEVVAEFAKEEGGKISKQSIVAIGAILTTLGLAEIASSSHLCPPQEPWNPGVVGGEGGSSSGAGPCCFIAGTKILMANDSRKNIEKVKIGDLVKSYNEKTGKLENKRVYKIDTPMHDDMIVIEFENGVKNTNTKDHPYYVKGKGWCSYNPKLTLKRYKIKAKKLEKGDKVLYYNKDKLKKIKLLRIKEKNGEVQTYNLGGVKDNHNYFANGILVHNKDGEGGDGGGCCFEPHQSVLTMQGPLEIKDVAIGSKVVSYDEEKDRFTSSIVEKIIVHDGKISNMNNFIKHSLIKISVDINGKIFYTKVTDNHPYLDVTNKKFKPLKDFKVGDKIKTIDGEGVIISKDALIDSSSPPEMQKEIVYNLHMKEGPHNYIVNGAVVHNKL